jgi:hypothetical protein
MALRYRATTLSVGAPSSGNSFPESSSSGVLGQNSRGHYTTQEKTALRQNPPLEKSHAFSEKFDMKTKLTASMDLQRNFLLCHGRGWASFYFKETKGWHSPAFKGTIRKFQKVFIIQA